MSSRVRRMESMLSFDNMMILPLATEPFTPPTDRDMVPSERRLFVHTHRTCVFGTARRADGPAMSVVYYVPTDDDELLVSTMRGRGKARAVDRHGKVSVCVLDERWPFAYLQVYCDASVDEDSDLIVDVMMAVAARMSGEPLAEDARPFVAAMATEEDRVVLRCRPYATFAQPPRHLHRNDQAEPITHWVSASMPWDAPDPTEVQA
jgi:Pyridoxamine 5'-phosphate oxidase